MIRWKRVALPDRAARVTFWPMPATMNIERATRAVATTCALTSGETALELGTIFVVVPPPPHPTNPAIKKMAPHKKIRCKAILLIIPFLSGPRPDSFPAERPNFVYGRGAQSNIQKKSQFLFYGRGTPC